MNAPCSKVLLEAGEDLVDEAEREEGVVGAEVSLTEADAAEGEAEAVEVSPFMYSSYTLPCTDFLFSRSAWQGWTSWAR